jgi:hypothetical protein
MQNNINLEEVLEKIIFDKDNLTMLKEVINKVGTGQLSLRELRQKIIELRAHLLDELVKFVPFYIKQTASVNSLKEFTQDEYNITKLENELREKNEFLTRIGSRINNVYEKLKNTIENPY